MVYTPDIGQMRQNYANALAGQQQKALKGVSDLYAQRGVTGGGEEAVALGELGNQWGQAAGMQENQLQQYLGNLGLQEAQMKKQSNQFMANLGEQRAARAQQGTQFGQSLGEQQRQFNTGQGNWQQQFGENTRQFDVGQGNWQQQFGANQTQQQFANNLSMIPLIQQGTLNQQQAFGNQGSPFGEITTDQQMYSQSPEYQYAVQMGYQNPTQMAYAAQADPEWFKNNMYNKGMFGENMNAGNRAAVPQWKNMLDFSQGRA